MPNTTEQRKKTVLAALEKSLGVVTTACRSAGVGRTQFYEWMRSDPEFKAAVEDTGEIALDFTESKLFSAIQSGNIAAIIFHLKTKGKRRGYVESSEVVNYDPQKEPTWLTGSSLENA